MTGDCRGRGHGHGDLGEGSGPKGLVAGIVDVGRDVDQARRVVGRFGHVDDLGRELAAVLPDAEKGLLAGLDPDGVALGDPEPEEERVAADERRQDGPGLDVLAGLDRPGLDDARDGGPDEGVAKVELGLVEGRARLGDVGGRGQHLGPPGLDLFARDEPGVLGDDGLAPLQPGLGVGLRRPRPFRTRPGPTRRPGGSARSRSRRGPGRRWRTRPRVKRTRSTAPETRAVTWTFSKASTEPTAATE